MPTVRPLIAPAMSERAILLDSVVSGMSQGIVPHCGSVFWEDALPCVIDALYQSCYDCKEQIFDAKPDSWQLSIYKLELVTSTSL